MIVCEWKAKHACVCFDAFFFEETTLDFMYTWSPAGVGLQGDCFLVILGG
jgi:hypothetical protein